MSKKTQVHNGGKQKGVVEHGVHGKLTDSQQGKLKWKGHWINRTSKKTATTSREATRKKQAWKKAEGRRRRLLVRLALGRVVAEVGTPVRVNRREGTSCGAGAEPDIFIWGATGGASFATRGAVNGLCRTFRKRPEKFWGARQNFWGAVAPLAPP